MLAYQRGDSLAFEVLYMRHKNSLFNFLYKSCQQHALVEDLAHDIWMSIIRTIENYEAVATFKTFLYRIARNKIIDHWRKLKEQESQTSQFDEQQYLSETITDNENNKVLVQEVLQAIMQLPEQQRETFLLREQGFSQKEIADITNSKPETVKSRIRYATQQLKELAEQQL